MMNPNNPQPEPLANTVTTAMMVMAALLFTFVLIVSSFPLLRDWVLVHSSERTLAWLVPRNAKISAWVDWLRLIFEILLGLLISNQVFNDQLRSLFEQASRSLRTWLSAALEESIQADDTPEKMREAFNTFLISLNRPVALRELLRDIPILFKMSYVIYIGARHQLPNLFVKIILLRLLGAFSGKLHGTFALVSFCAVVLLKVAKLYLDSPLLKRALLH